MAASTGPALLAGAITLANEAVFAPVASGGKITEQFNWRILPATAAWAALLAGLERLTPPFAKGLAWLGVGAVLFFPFGNAPAPITNLSKALGYAPPGKAAHR